MIRSSKLTPPRRRHILLRLAGWIVVVLVAALALAVTVFNVQRAARETRYPVQLAPASGAYVTAGDANVFVQSWGPADGPVLVLVHGTGAWSGTWFDLPATLAARGWRVVAVDLPPFGMSTPAQAGQVPAYTREAQAARLRAVMAGLSVKQVTLVGHSFGAGPALEAAVQDPTRLRQLVLVDPALGLGAEGEAPACTRAPLVDALLSLATIRVALVSATATVPPFTAALLKQFVHRQDVITDALVAPYQLPFARQGFSASLGDWAHTFARANCESARSLQPAELTTWAARGLPVALIWGAEDTITPLAQAASLQKWIAQATLSVLPGVGHIPHIEDPQGFARALLSAVGSSAGR